MQLKPNQTEYSPQELDQAILKHSFALPLHPATEDLPLRIYSVGLHMLNLPELLIFSIKPEYAHQLVSRVKAALEVAEAAGGIFLGRVNVGLKFDIYLKEVDFEDAKTYLPIAMARSDNKAKVLQICLPAHGLFPWEPGYPADTHGYPVIGGNPQFH